MDHMPICCELVVAVIVVLAFLAYVVGVPGRE